MKVPRPALALCAAAVTVWFAPRARAQAGVDLLENGGFEYMTTGLSNGNHIGTTPAGWTLSAGKSNLQQGTAVGTGSVPHLAAYSGPYSGGASTLAYNSDASTGGNHWFDGTQNNAAGFTIIYQPFSLTDTAPTTLTGSFALGLRDQGGGLPSSAANASFVSIIDTASNATVFAFKGDLSTAYTAANPTGWEVNTFRVTLPAGTYRYQINLYDTQNIDAVALVPEPSAWRMAALGGGLLALCQRLRARRV